MVFLAKSTVASDSKHPQHKYAHTRGTELGKQATVKLGACEGPDLDHAVEKFHIVPMAGSCQVLRHLVGDLLCDTLRYTTVQV